MGSKLAHAAHYEGLGGTVSDRARIVLNHMAWSSFDDPKEDKAAAEYWGGHVALGHALLGLEHGGSPAAIKATTRAITELIDAGLIERIRDGQGKNRAVYRVLVGGRWKPAKAVDNSDRNGCEPLFGMDTRVHT